MTKLYKKKDKDTLEITDTVNETHVTEENRVDIQTKLDHLELDVIKSALSFQNQINELKNKLAVLDA